MPFYKKQKFKIITVTYWFLFVYIIAALVWWFIALEEQNKQMYLYSVEALKKYDPSYIKKHANIDDLRKRKNAQYIGEGSIFLLLILVCAVFVYRATRRQILLSNQQQNFMMAVTHELKTPIAVACLNLETLQKRKLDEDQQQKLIASTLQEANRLNELTNNILVASQLETGAYAINKQELNFSELAENCIQKFKHRFSSCNLQSEIEKNIFVEAELLLLQMLINNLLDNAYKYSSKNSIIKLTLIQNNYKVKLSVSDNGLGISDAEKKKVFNKFYRIGSETTRTAKGTGLGLYVCKKIAEDHNGKITVTDNQPQGSIFTVVMQTVLL
ncbi:MAG: sensor histidine kinase [Chitinophagaceae bacterium]